MVLWLLALAARAGPAVTSAGDAARVLARGVEALGGESALRSITSIERTYVEDWVDVGQGRRPWSGAPPVGNLPPHAGFDDSEAFSHLDYRGVRYYESIRHADAPNDYAVVVEAGTPERAFQTITYVREKPFYAPRDGVAFESERQRRFRRFPEGLLLAALERPESLAALGTVVEGAHRLEAIAFADTTGNLTRLYFDAATHRLVRSETVRTHRVYGDTTGDTTYGDYRRVGALELPFEVTTRVAGLPTSRLTMRAIATGSPARPQWFEPPRDFALVTPPRPEPAVESLGGGIHLIRGAYNLVFAEFRDHVLLIEAPMSEKYAADCLDLVAATVPGKPIRLVATHFHFDHVAGVRAAVARGIPILTTPDARGVIERSVASAQNLRPDALARAPRRASIEVADRSTVLDDGSQRVELYEIGPTPHVDQILVAYFPLRKLLLVADLFDVLTPELVITGVDGVALASRIDELDLDVDHIVPMHGPPVAFAQLRQGLEIRRKYEESPR